MCQVLLYILRKLKQTKHWLCTFLHMLLILKTIFFKILNQSFNYLFIHFLPFIQIVTMGRNWEIFTRTHSMSNLGRTTCPINNIMLKESVLLLDWYVGFLVIIITNLYQVSLLGEYESTAGFPQPIHLTNINKENFSKVIINISSKRL